MPIKILMPALSPTMTEGNLAKWHKSVGEEVHAGDVIAEIETDKATMEVEAVDEGVLGRILVEEGTEGVPVNQVIGMLLEEGEDADAVAEFEPEAPAAPPPSEPARPPRPTNGEAAPAAQAPGIAATPLARRIAGQEGVDLSGIAGTGAHGKIVRSDVEAAGLATAAQAAPPPPSPAARGGGERIFASPIARRMAAEGGLDLGAIAGSGPGGRIVKTDIEAALAGPRPAARAPAARPAGRPGVESELTRMSTMRKIIAERMALSKSTVPHFYLTVDCEIDELLTFRRHLNEAQPDIKVSVNDIVIAACARALRDVPEANVSYEDGQFRVYHVVDISVAVAIDGGLITPIVRQADTKTLGQIATEMKDLAERARAGKLMPEEYQGGSFSISNLGMFGVKQFDAVINPPQAAILAVGAGEPRPVVKDGSLAVATVMSCTLSVDHRAIDGAIGARLLAAIKRYLEYPPAMLF